MNEGIAFLGFNILNMLGARLDQEERQRADAGLALFRACLTGDRAAQPSRSLLLTMRCLVSLSTHAQHGGTDSVCTRTSHTLRVRYSYSPRDILVGRDTNSIPQRNLDESTKTALHCHKSMPVLSITVYGDHPCRA